MRLRLNDQAVLCVEFMVEQHPEKHSICPFLCQRYAITGALQLFTTFLQLLQRKGRHKRTRDEWKKFHESSIVRVLNPYRAAWNRMKGAEFCSRRWSPSTNFMPQLWYKIAKNRRFWGEMYQIYPICLKMSTSDFARILPKSRMRFFVAAWIFTTGGTVLRAYRQSWQTKPQQFPKENFGEGDIFSPAVYYRCTCWRTCPVTRRGGTTNRCIAAINHGFIIMLSFISR